VARRRDHHRRRDLQQDEGHPYLEEVAEGRCDHHDGIDLAETLEAYNAGAIGPGHCEDKECDDKEDCRYVPDECEPQIIWLYNCACIEDAPPQDPCGPCDGKVTWLRLQYRAGETARIRVYQKKIGDPIFDETVEPGGIFEVEGQDKKGTLGTEITIQVGCKEIKIHTSCSQPIYPGLVKGDFLVLAGASLNGGLMCPPGDAPALPKKRCGDCDDDD